MTPPGSAPCPPPSDPQLHAVFLGVRRNTAVRRTVSRGRSEWESEETGVEREEEIKGAVGEQRRCRMSEMKKNTLGWKHCTRQHTLYTLFIRCSISSDKHPNSQRTCCSFVNLVKSLAAYFYHNTLVWQFNKSIVTLKYRKLSH